MTCPPRISDVALVSANLLGHNGFNYKLPFSLQDHSRSDWRQCYLSPKAPDTWAKAGKTERKELDRSLTVRSTLGAYNQLDRPVQDEPSRSIRILLYRSIDPPSQHKLDRSHAFHASFDLSRPICVTSIDLTVRSTPVLSSQTGLNRTRPGAI
ncbi:unnamed protein product [Microthlaspi erraticum]|uniref:Uncharacterized protein n=1 Tax=Microthlaspi erraticum TaxID=1685480 RepID=A0A6D2HZ05_9BRAS|nr:unnamed protein product [Microthlaspi erraticum]